MKSRYIACVQFCFSCYTGYNFTEASRKDLDSSVLTYHRIVEAFKFAYAYRALLGDEDFWNVTEVSIMMQLFFRGNRSPLQLPRSNGP